MLPSPQSDNSISDSNPKQEQVKPHVVQARRSPCAILLGHPSTARSGETVKLSMLQRKSKAVMDAAGY